MANLQVGDKARRATGFMVGTANRQVRRAMAAHGFSNEVVAEGMRRLTVFLAARLGTQPALDLRVLGDLDAWENRWYPLIELVLRFNFPDVHELVFRNLRQTEGVEVVASVATLTDRLTLIAKPIDEGGLGERGQAACSLLVERGATERVLTDARDLLAQVGSVKEPDLLESEDPEAVAAAEEDLWRWYLEWSGIARIAIRDRRLLRVLGFLKTVRRPDGTEEEVVVNDDEEADTEPPVPAPTPHPTPTPTDIDPTEV